MGYRKLPVPDGYLVGELPGGRWQAVRVDGSAKSNELGSRYSAVHWCLSDKLRQMEAEKGTRSSSSGRTGPGNREIPRHSSGLAVFGDEGGV